MGDSGGKVCDDRYRQAGVPVLLVKCVGEGKPKLIAPRAKALELNIGEGCKEIPKATIFGPALVYQ